MRQSATHESDERNRELHEAPGDAAGVHDVPGEDEQRQRKQHEVVHPTDDLLRERQLPASAHRQVDGDACRERDENGHAQQDEQAEKRNDQTGDQHHAFRRGNLEVMTGTRQAIAMTPIPTGIADM